VASHPYQICLHIGKRPEILAATYVEIDPKGDTLEEVITAIEASGLTAADLRTRTLFCAVEGSNSLATMVYAALIGFAGRRLDFTTVNVEGTVGEVVVATSLHNAASSLESHEAEGDPEAWVQVGALHPTVPSVEFGSEISDNDVSLMRRARRCRITKSEFSSYDIMTLLVTVAAFRVRNGADRLPFLVQKSEEEFDYVDGEGETIVCGIDLDSLRRAGGELRRSRRLDDRNAIVDSITPGARIQRISKAASLPVEFALTLLGSKMQQDTELWHCPRPSRHKNGDANASMKVADGKIRCFRCDPEPMDALRLISEVRNLTADDAADLLLGSS